MDVRVPSGPGAVTVLLFLSYADEDSEIAREIATRLRTDDVSVYSANDSVSRFDSTATEPEYAIQRADAFLALLSPNSLTSTSCRRERELALYREQRNRDSGTETDFVQVLQIRETPYHQAGSLHIRPWFYLTGQAAKERVLNDLASKFEPRAGSSPSGSHPPAGANGGHTRPPSRHFRNRERELEEVRAGITNEDGEHFWLIIAPPQLGKTWFLGEIGDGIGRSVRWEVKFVDARDLPPEVVGDADAILRIMFGLEPPASAERTITEIIATTISRKDRFQLCLLDSAELLDDNTVRTLRRYLSEINKGVAEARNPNARLALVAASRRENEWKGVHPAPRLQIRRLTEFKVEVINEALHKLAQDMHRPFTLPDLQPLAQRVHALSEGLPSLLVGCLNWIREREWTGLERLEDQATFEEIARPYIDNELLSPSSLRGFGSMPTSAERAAIQKALLTMSPYRFLTVSHLSRHTKQGDLQDAIDLLGWSVEHLWAAVSGTDLLYRPLREPWLEIYAPIRRLLFRHSYPSHASRGQAHHEACDFMQSFIIGQSGSDQCRVLVECLWHEAQALILEQPEDLAETLIRFARELDARLTPNPAFDKPALRDYAAWCMTNDQEFAENVASFPGLFDRLVEAVRHP